MTKRQIKERNTFLIKAPKEASVGGEMANCAFVLGYFGFGNFGDEMTRNVVAETLEERGLKVRFWGRGREVVCDAVIRKSYFAMRRALVCSSLFVLGGGTLLQSETSLRSLFFYTHFCKLASRHKIPSLFLFGGVGPLKGRLEKRMAKRALESFSCVYFRTEGDLLYAKDVLGFSGKYALGGDICLCFPQKPLIKGDKTVFIPKGKARPDDCGFTPDRTLILFPDEDASLSEGEIIVRTAEEFFLACNGACATITQRLHGAVFSLLYGVPVFLKVESEKNRRFYEDVYRSAEKLGVPCPVFPFQRYAEISPELQKIKNGTCPDFGASSVKLCEKYRSRNLSLISDFFSSIVL